MEYYEGSPKSHKYVKYCLIAFSFFVVVLFLLIYTPVSRNFSITGSSVRGSNESIHIHTDLTIPDLDLKGEFAHIQLEGNSDSFLYVGDQKFYLANSEINFITLKNYNGKISFNHENVSELRGKVAEIKINGVPIMAISNGTMKVYFGKNFDYSFLSIEDEVFIKELIYITNGSIELNDGRNIFNLADEEILIEDFYGNVILENNRFNIEGYLNRLEMLGDSAISVSV